MKVASENDHVIALAMGEKLEVPVTNTPAAQIFIANPGYQFIA